MNNPYFIVERVGMDTETSYNKYPEFQAWEEGKQAGIKEVVEFINNLIIGIDGCRFEERLDGDKGCIVLDMNENQWQSKLKSWGID